MNSNLKLIIYASTLLISLGFPAISTAATLGVSKAPEVVETKLESTELIAQRGPQIDWGPLATYFNISNIEAGMIEYKDMLGKVQQVPAITFTVEATRTFMLAMFFAHFYDAEGIEVAPFAGLTFQPDYSTWQWQPGNRSRATLMLPSNFDRVALIKFTEL